MDRVAGSYVQGAMAEHRYRAFVPVRLPPQPPLAFDGALIARLEGANQALGRLDGMTHMLPDPQLFLYHFVRKEALLSSQIEGTQSPLSDLLLSEVDEAPGVPIADVGEVSLVAGASRTTFQPRGSRTATPRRGHPKHNGDSILTIQENNFTISHANLTVEACPAPTAQSRSMPRCWRVSKSIRTISWRWSAMRSA